MSLINYAQRELKAVFGDYRDLSRTSQDPDVLWSALVAASVEDQIREFAGEGHSGASAASATQLFSRLSKFLPLTPLTGEDSEWNLVKGDYGQGGDTIYQNNRCSHVFKDSSGAYDIDGYVFEDSNGERYTSKKSRKAVTFPYYPPTTAPVVKIAAELGSDFCVREAVVTVCGNEVTRIPVAVPNNAGASAYVSVSLAEAD